MTDEIKENEMAMEALKWIVHDIQERKREIASTENDDFSVGKRTAYFEIMDMIASRLEIMDINLDNLEAVEP